MDKELKTIWEETVTLFGKAGIALTPEEKGAIEMADFGLKNPMATGLQLVTYVNTERCCAKELVLLPHQTCPEHLHPPIPEFEYPGKEETFRCRFGEVYIYLEGEAASAPACKPPQGEEAYYTVWHEVHLKPGEQITLLPCTRHWFQAGPKGAVVSEFSTKSYDEYDVFTNPLIIR